MLESMTNTIPPDVDPVVWEAIKQLVTDERDGGRIPLSVGPYTAFTMLGALQLAFRHPAMEPKMKQLIRDFGHQLEGAFAGGPLQEVLDKGWYQDFDVRE